MRSLLLLAFVLLAVPAQGQPNLADYVIDLSICSPRAQPTARNCSMMQALGPDLAGLPGLMLRPPDPAQLAFAEQWRGLLDTWRRGDAASARSRLEAMRSAFPDRTVLLHLRAHMRRAQGDLDGALADLQTLEQRGLANNEVLADICSVRFRQGDRAAATAICVAALPPTSISGAWYLRSVRAGVLLASGDPAGAEADIAWVLRGDPHHPLALRLRAWQHSLRGETAEEAEDLRLARSWRPDVDAELRELLGAAPPSPPPSPSPPNRR